MTVVEPLLPIVAPRNQVTARPNPRQPISLAFGFAVTSTSWVLPEANEVMAIHPAGPLRRDDIWRVLVVFSASWMSACGGQLSARASPPEGGPPLLDVIDAVGPTIRGCAPGTVLAESNSGCAGGSVRFRLSAPHSWNYTETGDTNAAGANWLTIHCASGDLVDLFPAGDTPGLDCRSCGGAPRHFTPAGGIFRDSVPDGGLTGMWDGLFYALQTCPGSSTECLMPACAWPGRYQAEMCACADAQLQSGGCWSASEGTCVTVTFDYPSSTLVTALLPPPDASL